MQSHLFGFVLNMHVKLQLHLRVCKTAQKADIIVIGLIHKKNLNQHPTLAQLINYRNALQVNLVIIDKYYRTSFL